MQLLKKMKKYFEKSHVFKDTELIELALAVYLGSVWKLFSEALYRVS